MRRVLKQQVRRTATSKPLEDTDSSRERTFDSSDVSSLLDRIDKLVSSSRIPSDPIRIQ
jgi:hypothetical protein